MYQGEGTVITELTLDVVSLSQVPVSRAKSIPVPGVVDYFRPVLAAVQELSRARSSRNMPGIVIAV